MLSVPPLKTLSILALGFTLAACSNQVDPDSPEGKRQAAFKQIINHSEPLGGMLQGRLPFDGQAFAAHTEGLVELVDAPWAYFSAGPESDQRHAALPEVWSDPQGFEARIEQYREAVTDLASVTRKGVRSAAQVADPLQAVQQACRACHDGYRR